MPGVMGALLLLLAAVVCAAVPLDPERFVALRVLIGSIAVAILPGWAIAHAVGRRAWGDDDPDVLEQIPFAFGLTLVAVCVATVVCLRLELPIRAGAVLLGAVTAAALAVAAWRRVPPPARGLGGAAGVTLAAALLALVPLLYEAGALYQSTPDREEALHVLMSRKLLENDAPTTRNIFYKPDTVTTYLFPPYHFMLALIAHVSGLDPLVSYVRLRPLWCVLALLALYGVARRALGERAAAAATALFLAAMVWSGRAEAWRGPFGRLAPYSHHADFALGVTVPVGLLVLCRFLYGRPGPAAWLATPLVLMAITVIHTREGIQFIAYLVAALLSALLVSRERAPALRAVVALAAFLALVVPYNAMHRAAVDHIAEWEQAVLTHAHRLLEQCGADALPCLVNWTGWDEQRYVTGWEISLHPYLLLGCLLAPLLLASSRPLLHMVAVAVLGWLVVVRVPLLALLAIRFSYSELLFSPARYVLHFEYLAVAALFVAIGGAAARLADLLLDRVPPGAAAVVVIVPGQGAAERLRLDLPPALVRVLRWALAPVLAGVVALQVPALASALATFCATDFDRFTVWALVVATAALVWRRKTITGSAALEPSAAGLWRPAALPVLAVVLAVVALDTEPPSKALAIQGGSLWEHAAHTGRGPRIDRLSRWLAGTRFLRMPRALLERIQRLPHNRLFAVDLEDVWKLPVVVNQQVYTDGVFLSTEIPLVETWAHLQGIRVPVSKPGHPRLYGLQQIYNTGIRANFPFYNDQDPPDLSLALLRDLRIEYLVWNKTASGQLSLERMVNCFPEAFGTVAEKGSTALLEVHRDRLTSLRERRCVD